MRYTKKNTVCVAVFCNKIRRRRGPILPTIEPETISDILIFFVFFFQGVVISQVDVHHN
jgi:hypothetical protein